jgi:acetyl esterase
MTRRAPRLFPGAIYLEHGKPVTILARWGKGGGPRNVAVERSDGTRAVRPFRGLRKVAENGHA